MSGCNAQLSKSIAPKFHEPLTELYTLIKKLSDIAYEIHDKTNNNTKIVYFECLNNATFRSVKLDESDNKFDHPKENDTDDAFEIVISLQRHVPQKLAATDVASQAKRVAAAAAKVKPNSPQLANGANPVQPIVEQRQAAEASKVIAKKARLVSAADEQAAAPTRVSGRLNKGQPPSRTSCRCGQQSAQSRLRFYYRSFSLH